MEGVAHRLAQVETKTEDLDVTTNALEDHCIIKDYFYANQMDLAVTSGTWHCPFSFEVGAG